MTYQPDTTTVDPHLADVLELVEKHIGLACTIRFVHAGVLIQGDIISEEYYLQKRAQNIHATSVDAVTNAAYPRRSRQQDAFEQAFLEYWRTNGATPHKDGIEKAPPKYLHLQNVRLLASSSVESEFWRGELAKIDSILDIGPFVGSGAR